MKKISFYIFRTVVIATIAFIMCLMVSIEVHAGTTRTVSTRTNISQVAVYGNRITDITNDHRDSTVYGLRYYNLSYSSWFDSSEQPITYGPDVVFRAGTYIVYFRFQVYDSDYDFANGDTFILQVDNREYSADSIGTVGSDGRRWISFTVPITVTAPSKSVNVTQNITAGGTVTAPVTAVADTQVNLSTTVNEGYEFVSWTSDDVSITNSSSPTAAYFTMPADPVTVRANYRYVYTVRFRVINGKWDDDSTDDKIVYVRGFNSNNQIITLASNQIPGVGSKPNDGFRAGGWDTTPNTTRSIRANATYTYTYLDNSSTAHAVSVTDDGHGRGSADPSSASNDAEIRLSATPDDGYVFDRWTTTDNIVFANASSASTTFRMIDSPVTVKANFKSGSGPSPTPEPQREDSSDNDVGSNPKPSDPNASISTSFTMTGSSGSSSFGHGNTKIGPQVQGPIARGVFAHYTPKGWKQAFTFNMTVNNKANYSRKTGLLSFKIPLQYLKVGRKYIIRGINQKGEVKTFADADNRFDTVSANIDIEGYAFDLIYFD